MLLGLIISACKKKIFPTGRYPIVASTSENYFMKNCTFLKLKKTEVNSFKTVKKSIFEEKI
jgi:hypothetical protein